jgi:hypothetical protein
MSTEELNNALIWIDDKICELNHNIILTNTNDPLLHLWTFKTPISLNIKILKIKKKRI